MSGRKRDFPDAERLVKRLVAQELTLSFVPDAEQRLWRTVMRKYQITRNRVQLHNRLASLLEEAHINIRYEDRGPAVSVEARKVRTRKMIRELRTLGYHVELFPAPSSNPA